MCTSIVWNRRKTLVGWNLDLIGMEVRVRPRGSGVFIEINDEKEGWMPLFGANARGEFVGMPTCWPFDSRSDPPAGLAGEAADVIHLDIDLLTEKKTFSEVLAIARSGPVYSVPGVTYMSVLSDSEGNVLRVVPGQGISYLERPAFAVTTNFSPFKMNAETHPWMGWDRYEKATEMLSLAGEDFDVPDLFGVLRAVSQTVCPTVVSMVFDVTAREVFWCENREYDRVQKKVLSE